MKNDKEYTFHDLRHKYHTGRAYIISGSGRDKKMGYRHGVMCEIGDIEESKWVELMQDLITRYGEQELHQHLVEWVENYPWNYTKYQIKMYALELHSSRIFDNEEWVNFIQFNQKYRPEILQNIKMCTVITDCCNTPGQITVAQEQHSSYIDGEKNVCCPICGKWSTYRLL